jgi:hypothetical protein
LEGARSRVKKKGKIQSRAAGTGDVATRNIRVNPPPHGHTAQAGGCAPVAFSRPALPCPALPQLSRFFSGGGRRKGQEAEGGRVRRRLRRLHPRPFRVPIASPGGGARARPEPALDHLTPAAPIRAPPAGVNSCWLLPKTKKAHDTVGITVTARSCCGLLAYLRRMCCVSRN